MSLLATILEKWLLAEIFFKHLIKTVYGLDNPQGQYLKRPDGITFDPLGVAAILNNPRADCSAARLYTTTEHDKQLFRWPHTTMFGGALVPLKTLVEHLTSNMTSLHPAVKMCQTDIVTIAVKSDMIFKELPFNFSTMWLRDVIAFQPSSIPQNDVVVVSLDLKDTPDTPLESRSIFRKALIDLTGFVTGALLIGSVYWSFLWVDVWGASLFIIYTIHWFASTLIAFCEVITYETPKVSGKMDTQTYHYAVHERMGGGIVVFRGYKIVFEKLARSRWVFNRSWRNNFLHWFWMTSGALSALASVACMVNMQTELQLAFLGILSYSSLAEIWVTQFARGAQLKALIGARGDYLRPQYIRGKQKRAFGMIHASLALPAAYRLQDVRWTGLGLLPPPFEQLQVLLDTLNGVPNEKAPPPPFPPRPISKIEFEEAIAHFRENFAIRDPDLIDELVEEVRAAWKLREQGPDDKKPSTSKV